jgi:hypothetical protein
LKKTDLNQTTTSGCDRIKQINLLNQNNIKDAFQTIIYVRKVLNNDLLTKNNKLQTKLCRTVKSFL